MVKIARGKAVKTAKARGGRKLAATEDAVAVAGHGHDGSEQGYGAAKVVALDADDKARLGIAYAPFKVEIIDIDVILVFKDGSRVIVPGMALASFSGRKPMLLFNDKEFSADQAVAMVGEIKQQDTDLKLQLSSSHADQQTEKPDGGTKPQDGGQNGDQQGAAVQPADAAAAQAQAQAQQAQQHTSDGQGKALTEKISNTQPSSSAPAGVISPKSATPAPEDALGAAGIGKLVPKLVYTLYNSEGQHTSSINGVQVLKGDTGGPNSSKDAGYGAQSAKETLTGSSAADIIYADDPAHAPPGTTMRVLHVEAEVPAKGLSLLQVLVPSLPAGY